MRASVAQSMGKGDTSPPTQRSSPAWWGWWKVEGGFRAYQACACLGHGEALENTRKEKWSGIGTRGEKICQNDQGGSLSYYGKLRNIAYFAWKNRSRWQEPEQSFRHRPRATGCILARGGSDWLAAGATAPAMCQLLGLLWRQGASEWRKMEEVKKQDPPASSGGRGSWRRKREIHGPIPTLPKFFLPRDPSQLLPSSHQFLLPRQHLFCWSASKGRLFLYYCVFTQVTFTQVAFIRKGDEGSAPGKLETHDSKKAKFTWEYIGINWPWINSGWKLGAS